MAKIMLKNVRLSFPSLYNRSSFNGVEGKFEATFLIPKSNTELKAELDAAIEGALKESKVKVPSDKICLKDGNDSDYTGYADHWSFKAGNSKRPTLIDRDKTQLVAEDNVLYAGCYVNAIVDVWVQNNNYGKRVSANLFGVQFFKEGEPFGRGDVDVTDEFEDFDDL